jgi:hypothetical protein
MQVNRTGYLLFALFGLGGLAFIVLGIALPSVAGGTFLLIGIIWVLVTAGLIVYAIRQRQKGEHDEWLWKTGVRGKGTLVGANSGALINEQPLMTLELDLDVPGQQPRRVKRKVIISNFAAHIMEPGLVLPVYVNPQDPEDILIVW